MCHNLGHGRLKFRSRPRRLNSDLPTPASAETMWLRVESHRLAHIAPDLLVIAPKWAGARPFWFGLATNLVEPTGSIILLSHGRSDKHILLPRDPAATAP